MALALARPVPLGCAHPRVSSVTFGVSIGTSLAGCLRRGRRARSGPPRPSSLTARTSAAGSRSSSSRPAAPALSVARTRASVSDAASSITATGGPARIRRVTSTQPSPAASRPAARRSAVVTGEGDRLVTGRRLVDDRDARFVVGQDAQACADETLRVWVWIGGSSRHAGATPRRPSRRQLARQRASARCLSRCSW
jgi:hypothetical protein